MKYSFVIAAAVLLQGCDQGSMLTTSTMQSDSVMRLEAAGDDLRIYEFTPVTAPRKQCVFVAGTSKGGLFCFDKPIINES